MSDEMSKKDVQEIINLMTATRAEEREACAKVAEEFGWHKDDETGLDNYSGSDVATAIRKRWEK